MKRTSEWLTVQLSRKKRKENIVGKTREMFPHTSYIHKGISTREINRLYHLNVMLRKERSDTRHKEKKERRRLPRKSAEYAHVIRRMGVYLG